MDYIAIIHKNDVGILPTKSDYGVSFPDFDGCVTAGKTLEEAKNNAIEALSLHVQGMLEDGETIPAPSNLDDVMKIRDFKDGVAFMVNLSSPQKVVRVNITVTEDDLRKIDNLAQTKGMSRSAYLIQSGLQ
jgi:predicted RNase H-like HicB family nuclease